MAATAALVAWVQYRAHLRTERARTRPYVIVDFAFRSVLMQVEIKNIGATPARNVVLRVDPPFESGYREQADALNAVFSGDETITMLAPGRRILYTLDRAPDYYRDQRPERYMITASYTDLPVRYKRSWRTFWRSMPVGYDDEYPLDFRQWSKASAEVDYAASMLDIAKRGETREKQIVSALQKIASRAESRSSQGSVGDVVETVDQFRAMMGLHVERPASPAEVTPAQDPKPLKRRRLKPMRPRFRWTRPR